jgi:hypothetical protein
MQCTPRSDPTITAPPPPQHNNKPLHTPRRYTRRSVTMKASRCWLLAGYGCGASGYRVMAVSVRATTVSTSLPCQNCPAVAATAETTAAAAAGQDGAEGMGAGAGKEDRKRVTEGKMQWGQGHAHYTTRGGGDREVTQLGCTKNDTTHPP